MNLPMTVTAWLVVVIIGCRPSGTAEAPSATTQTTQLSPVTEGKSRPSSRSFVFHYDFRLHSLDPQTSLRIWLPVPRTNEWQTITIGDVLADAVPQATTEAENQNKLYYFEMTVPDSGEVTFRIPYHVTRREVRLRDLSESETSVSDTFLTANLNVPVSGKAQALLKNAALPKDPLQKARSLYNLVDEHVRYSKDGEGWGQGDVDWVCDSRYGNCTDFHSLFISLATSQQIPARFEIGFPVPTEADSGNIGGYHCWGRFHIKGKGWVPVDISEADKHPEMKDYYFGNLTPNRFALSTGRDLVLEPKQDGPPLNFFVYPYVETGGKPLDQKHVDLEFSFGPG